MVEVVVDECGKRIMRVRNAWRGSWWNSSVVKKEEMVRENEGVVEVDACVKKI